MKFFNRNSILQQFSLVCFKTKLLDWFNCVKCQVEIFHPVGKITMEFRKINFKVRSDEIKDFFINCWKIKAMLELNLLNSESKTKISKIKGQFLDRHLIFILRWNHGFVLIFHGTAFKREERLTSELLLMDL